MPHPIVDRARTLVPLVQANAEAGEELRTLPPGLVAAFRDAGLFRMAVPADYGGPAVDVPSLLEAIEVISAADGAAGWCVNISSTTSSMANFLAPEWAHVVFDDPSGSYGGGFAPNGRAVRVDGGWRVDGRWMWGSGTQHATWITGGTLTEDNAFHTMFFPAADVELLDTWYAAGLKGTGSTDFLVRNVFVPEGRSVVATKGAPALDSALARFPNFNLLALGLAAVCLGIARRAVDELVELAAGKTPQGSRRTLAEYAPAQLDVARAEAALGGARAFVYHEATQAWDTVLRGDRVSIEQRARVRLACHHAAVECAKAVDFAYGAGGGSSVFSSHPLQRCFRDIHTATQHLMLSDRNLLQFGRMRFGLESDTAML